MKRKIQEVIETLTKHYDLSEDIYIVWYSKGELCDNLGREATAGEWVKVVNLLEERDYIEEILNQEVAEALQTLKIEGA